MRAFVVSLVLLGCSRPEPPPPVTTASAPDATRPRAPRISDARRGEIAQQQAALAAIQARLRLRHYESQGTLQTPESLPGDLRACWPGKLTAKVVSAGYHRRMAQSRPKADTQRLMQRWITPSSGAETRAALRDHLTSQGWLAPGARLPVTHPERGRLEAQFIEHPERATAVELRLVRPDTEAPLEAPEAWLDPVPSWLSPAPGAVVGFEYDHHHGVVPRGVFTDVERYVVTLRGEPKALLEHLHRVLREAGYREREEIPGAFRHADGSSFRTKRVDGALVAHHQRRWKR